MRLGMPLSTEISIFGHANGLPFSKHSKTWNASAFEMKGALGSERKGSSALRASDPIALLPRGPFNLEDARIPRLTYTKTAPIPLILASVSTVNVSLWICQDG